MPSRSENQARLLDELRELEQRRENILHQLEAEGRDAGREASGQTMLKDDFLSMVSHELRTPLQILMGLCRIMGRSKREPLAPGQREYVDRMLDVLDSLAELVEDILDMGCVRAGTFKVAPERIDPGRLLRGVLPDLSLLAQQKGQRLTLTLAPELPDVWGDKRRVAQVVINLVKNAIKFTPESGDITIRTSAEARAVLVEVEDTGIGIPAEQMENLFKPFSRLPGSPLRSEWGAGLGLSICRAIVLAHGGEIGAMSQHGRGSRFWFTLPREPQAPPGR